METKTPNMRFKDFSEPWVPKKLGNICSKIGSGKTPRGGDTVYADEGVPFIRSQNVLDSTLHLDGVCITVETHEEMSGSKVCPGDVLLNITGGSIGRSCVVPADFVVGNVNQHVCIIRPEKDNSNFLQAHLASHRGQKLIFQGQTGSGREGLNFETIRGFKISFPSLPEQQKIASFLSSVDERIELMERKKEKLEAYKKGVMQQIFPSSGSGQAPQIRFKQDDGSAFPDWEEKRLGEVAIFSKGKGISKNDIDPNGNVECVRYGELYTDYKEVIDFVKSRTSLNPVGLVLSKSNDVLIPSSGETQIDIARVTCIIKSGVALGGDLNIIRSKLNGVFLSFYLNHRRKH
ncbi:MAG: restriction endonuclease subunit S [Nitritalea sp.]